MPAVRQELLGLVQLCQAPEDTRDGRAHPDLRPLQQTVQEQNWHLQARAALQVQTQEAAGRKRGENAAEKVRQEGGRFVD